MHATEQSAFLDEIASARRRALQRAERFDIMVACTVLMFLIFGWAVRFAPIETWPRGDFFVASTNRHA